MRFNFYNKPKYLTFYFDELKTILDNTPVGRSYMNVYIKSINMILQTGFIQEMCIDMKNKGELKRILIYENGIFLSPEKFKNQEDRNLTIDFIRDLSNSLALRNSI